MLYLGIDPGLDGALALIDSGGQLVSRWRMPLTTSRKISPVNTWALLQQIDDIATERMELVTCGIEKVITMPSDTGKVAALIDEIEQILLSAGDQVHAAGECIENAYAYGQEMKRLVGAVVGPNLDIAVKFDAIRALLKRTDGRVGVLNMGTNWGYLVGQIAALGWRYDIIPPRTWQAKMFKGLPSGTTKDRAHMLCQRLHPGTEFKFGKMTKPYHDGLCDALAMAEFTRLKYS